MFRFTPRPALLALSAVGLSLVSPVVAGMSGLVAPAAAAVECSPTVAGLDAPTVVTDVAWQQCPSVEAVQDQNALDIVGDPVGAGTLLLTTGKAAAAVPPNDSFHDWPVARYAGADDVVVLDLGLDVPDGHSCLAFDYVFASDESMAARTRANDGFIVELDSRTWRLDWDSGAGGALRAPDAFAHATVYEQYDAFQTPTHDTVTDPTVHGTAYAWTTRPRAVLLNEVTPGAHRLYFSVYEHIDGMRDSAVFLDNLRTFRDHPVGDCVEGNQLPTASADAAATAPGEVVSVPVTQNDADPDGDPLTVDSATQPEHGQVQCAAESCTYTPDPLWMGSDSFTYTVADGFGGTATASVQVDVAVVHLLEPGESVTTWPAGVDLTGTLELADDLDPLAGRTLELWAASGTDVGEPVASGQTDESGAAALWARPQRQTRYWVQPAGSGARSAEEATVSVRPLASLAAVERRDKHRLRGRVTPARVGTPVVLQRRLPGASWRTIARTTTANSSSALAVADGAAYSFSVRAKRGRVAYRVWLPADDGRLATYSAVRKLR